MMVPEDDSEAKGELIRICHTSNNGSVLPDVAVREGPTTLSNNYGSLGETCWDEEEQEEDNKNISQDTSRTYLSRFWILFISSCMCWLHCVLWSTWGPISESMNEAFDGWGSSTVAMMINWGTIMFVMWFIPMAWATQRCGLRPAMVCCGGLAALSTCIRVFTSVTPTFTILCHISAILVGMASTLALSAPMMIATDWFPLHERTTAFGVMMGASQLGGLGSYLEPLLVRLPGPHVSIQDIQNDVMCLMYIEAGMSVLLLLAILAYFPSKPPTPPSVTSASEKVDFLSGLRALAKNKQFIVMLVSYGMCVGPPVAWITILNYSLLPLGFHQDNTMWLGLVTVLASSISPVIAGRLNDLMKGHLKLLLILLMFTSSFCFYWFLLITYQVIPLSTWQVYVSVVVSLACNYATIPLFFELGEDLTFPASDILVSSVITAADNICSVSFLFITSIPNIGYHWMTYTLTLVSSVAIIPLLFIKFNYTRSNLDTVRTGSSSSINRSQGNSRSKINSSCSINS
ncbi:hypothetical protein Pmani_001686 [Petrolisthes manimaculis]|uniref:Uncharacterized protein n=1 Tax=Petrolisthes manimaculis TaxID=1843537 RepID=A0AAE1QK76_9EUCA|nr:hypothetical protein Pmani_001686 [Petrolisthes manimaculis]